MRVRVPIVGLAAAVLAAGVSFTLLQRRLTAPLLAFGPHPEVVASLEASLDDQRRLADFDPEAEDLYRERFAATETLLQRLRVLAHSREAIARRYEQVVVAIFAAVVVALAAGVALRQARQATRLERLRDALESLAAGRTGLELGERRRDVLGRIARMIEETSRRMARDRRRLEALENLSSWQEAARRHAHEMRTPLTGARLELERLEGLLESESLARGQEIRQAAASAGQEIERLGTFAQQFTSFARLPRPEKRVRDLSELLSEYVTTFEGAWPNLELVFAPPSEAMTAAVDRDMLRQVLVNLCDNSSLAVGEEGRVRVGLELSREGENVVLRARDDGPGVPEEVRGRLFKPYTTSRKIGQGMGLGLAISRKVLLDHDGDLELESSSEDGAVFRATLPFAAPETDA